MSTAKMVICQIFIFHHLLEQPLIVMYHHLFSCFNLRSRALFRKYIATNPTPLNFHFCLNCHLSLTSKGIMITTPQINKDYHALSMTVGDVCIPVISVIQLLSKCDDIESTIWLVCKKIKQCKSPMAFNPITRLSD